MLFNVCSDAKILLAFSDVDF